MNNRESPWRPIGLHHGPEDQAANLQSRIRDDRTSISSRQDLSLSNSSKERSDHASNSNLKTPPLRGKTTETNSKLSSKEFLDEASGQQNLQGLIRNEPCEPTHDTKLQSNYRGTCQWSQALLTSANSINRSSSSHSSERLQARMSPSSDAPSWDGVSVWVPNTSISRNSRVSSNSKSPSFPRHQLSVTPRSTHFKVDVQRPSLDSSNENIDQGSGHPSFLSRSQYQLPKNRGLSNCEIDRSPENYQLSRNTSLKSTPLPSTGLPTDNTSSERFSSNRLQCRAGQVRGTGRQQMKKHNSLQQESKQSKVRSFSTLGRNESHPNRQLCPDFLKPLEVLRKKMELLEEQELMNVPNSDSGSSSGPGCHGTSRESVSSFLSFEETLDRALEEQNDFVDSQAFRSNRNHLHGALENIEIPPISLGHQTDDLMAWRSNQQHFDDVRLSEEVAQNLDPFLPRHSSHKHKQAPDEPYSFVPNGQFLRLIEDTRKTEGSEDIVGVTQVVLNNQDNQNLNYFLKLHSSSKTQPSISDNRLQTNDQQSNPSSDKRLLNLHGILADIKKSIESSELKANSSASETGNQSNDGLHRSVQSMELNDSSSFIECPRNDRGDPKTNDCKKNDSILENFPTFHATAKTRTNTSTNNTHLHVVSKDSRIKSSPDSNEAHEYDNSLERHDSYRKLSPEKIKEISAWAEKTVSGFRGGNGRTDEIRMKDLLFKKHLRHKKDVILPNSCSNNPTTREVAQSPRTDILLPSSSLPTCLANMTNPGTGNQCPDAAPLSQGHNARAVNSAPSRQSSSDKQLRADKGLPCISSLDTSTESSRDARMEAIEASLDDIFNEFLERTLLTTLPYIDDPVSPSAGAPINESTSSLPAISSIHPSIHAPVISSLSTSNLKSPHSSSLDCDNLEKGLTSLLSSHLKTSSDQNLACSKPGSKHKDLSYNSTSIYEQHLNFTQQQQQQQQQQNDIRVQLMAFKDELTLLRSRLTERIQCLESEHAMKTIRLESKCSHLEQVLVETFALTKTATTGTTRNKSVATRASEADGNAVAFGFVRERLTNIKKVVMTCDSGDAVRPFVKSRKSKGQAPSSTGRKETMIDGSESESGEFVLHHRHHHQQHQHLSTHLATASISGEVNDDDDDDDGDGQCEQQEVYVIVLKDGITIEGIHATVPQGVNAPIKVHQQDLKDSFDAAFRALNDVIDSPSWTPSVSASDQRNQNMLGVSRRSQSQTSSSVRCSSADQQLSKQQQQQPQQQQQQQQLQHSQQHQLTTTRDPFLLQQPQRPNLHQHQVRPNNHNNESLLYYHHHHHQQQQQAYNSSNNNLLSNQQQQQPQIFRDENSPQRRNISSPKQRQFQQKKLQQQQQQQQRQPSQSGRHFNLQTFPVPPDSWFSKEHGDEDVGGIDDPQT